MSSVAKVSLSSSSSSSSGPDLTKYMDKQLQIELNGSRSISGILRGFDQFLNLTLESAVEVIKPSKSQKHSQNNNQTIPMGVAVIRGNSILTIEALEKVA